MNLDSRQIDRIVREVMRKLLTLDDAPSSLPVKSSSSVSSSAPGTLVIADRVVTMSSVSGRLVGVTRVQVPCHAVVTPLLSDSLREQGIKLERQSLPSSKDTAAQVAWMLVGDESQTSRVSPLLDQLAVGWRVSRDADDMLSQIATSACLKDRQTTVQRAIVLTADWAKIVCKANRNPNMRVASVCSSRTVQQACEQLDANVVVIDSTTLTDEALLSVVREYVRINRSASEGAI